MSLIKSAVTKSLPDDDVKNVGDDVLKDVFRLAKKHDLAHIVSDVLLKNKVTNDEELLGLCSQASFMALLRYQQQTYEFKRICDLFEANAIPYIPLKGAVIRELYPEPWMRSSCDIDILVHKEYVERISDLVVSEYNYKVHQKTTHDVIFVTEGGACLELHFKLIDDDIKKNGKYLRKWNANCLKNVWDSAYIADGTKYQYKLNDDIMYFYHIVHMAKHFETGGCGIKPLVDLWLINNSIEYDYDQRNQKLIEGNLLTFGNEVKKLSEVWFGEAEADETTIMMEKYILFGGVYGNIKNKVAYNQSKSGNKFRYAMSRIFVSYDLLKLYFPILIRHKWLMPVCQVGRWLKIIFKKRLKKSLNELGVNNQITGDTQVFMQEMIKKLEL